MREDKAKIDIIKSWVKKSRSRLDASKSEFEAGRLDTAASNLYFAMFYLIAAALTKKDVYLSKHSAVKAAFHRDFVNTGVVGKKYGELFQKLFDDRHNADYSPIIMFEEDEVKERIQQVEDFAGEFKKIMDLPG